MAINFPAANSVGQTHEENGITYIWDGEKWTAGSAEGLNEFYVKKGGDTMTGSLLLPKDPISNLEAATKQYVDNNSGGGGGGGGGGGETKADIYGTAKVWGTVALGVGSGLVGCTTSALPNGSNQVTFNTPMLTDDYQVVMAPIGTVAGVTGYVTGKDVNGFVVANISNANGNFTSDPIDFAVFDNIPAEIVVGSGTVANTNLYGTAKAWVVTTDNEGAVGDAFNIASVTRTGTGIYDVAFTTPMPNVNYAITLGGNAPQQRARTTEKTTTGFKVETRNATGTIGNNSFAAAVFNNEPAEVALTTFGDVINYSGPSAWGNVEAKTSNGLCTINGRTNVASVTRTAAGKYAVVFDTPMPAANYAVQLTCINDAGARQASVNDVTTTGFTAQIFSSAGAATDKDFTFTVFATNALPPKGGTGIDAWANVSADATVKSSFNVTVVKAPGNGDYDITFVNPMPTADYAVTATVSGDPGLAYGFSCVANMKTSAGFRMSVVGDQAGVFADNDFSFTINATNATLPTTFTEEEIQAVVDLAKSGSANGATAWGDVAADGTLNSGLNSTTTKLTTGSYQVTFQTPMPNADYSVNASTVYTGASATTNLTYIGNQTATGFEISIYSYSSGAKVDSEFNFTVHSTNVQLPLTVTQTQIESFKSTVTALEAAVTRINALEANEIVDDSTDSALLTLIASLATKIDSLEATVQAMQADHTTLMNNNNGGY